MSRKQEIYRDILRVALESTRNCLSWFRNVSPYLPLLPKWRRYLRSQYAVSYFVHNLYVSILEEEFTDHDIHFLNHQARSFFESNDESCPHYDLFTYYIQELFKEVPDDKRHQLMWEGPQEDYSWARPRPGWELEL